MIQAALRNKTSTTLSMRLEEMIQAAGQGKVDNVKQYLDANDSIYINGRDCKFGYTALLKASQYGHEDVVRLLLDRGADIEAKGLRCFRTSLSYACSFGHVSTAKVLLDRGATFVGDRFQMNPLHYASYHGKASLVKLLLQRGANVNTTSDDNWTALHYACKKNNCVCVGHLLKYGGAHFDDRNMADKSPLDIAIENNHKPTLDVLLAYKKSNTSMSLKNENESIKEKKVENSNHEIIKEKISQTLQRIKIDLARSNNNISAATNDMFMCLLKTKNKMNYIFSEHDKETSLVEEDFTRDLESTICHVEESFVEMRLGQEEMLYKGNEMNQTLTRMSHDIDECLLRMRLMA
jgi:ankyrin repeat protein